MARHHRQKGDPYTGNALKDGYTCLARRASLEDIENMMGDHHVDEYERSFHELGEHHGRGQPLRSAPFKDDDDGFFY